MWERSLEERGNYSVGISREAFWHVFAKIPRHTRQNAITEGDVECILTRNCEGTEQLCILLIWNENNIGKRAVCREVVQSICKRMQVLLYVY